MACSDAILSVAQMVAAEQALIDGGETVETLMERAGLGAAEWVWRLSGGRPVTVLCGPGNNGGDGYVIARELLRRGAEVSVISPLPPATDAARAASAACHGPRDRRMARGVFVDCLFGSGLTRPLSADMLALVTELAESSALRIAIDVPSGVSADAALALGEAALPQFDVTLALGAWKFAHWEAPARLLSRERVLVDIGIAPPPGAAHLLAKPRIAAPDPLAHKYSRGLCAVVGGAMPGAAILSARTAMHGGAGYVKLLAEDRPAAAPAELVVETDPLAQALAKRRPDAVVIGPGLGRGGAAQARLAAVLAAGVPALIDADALHLLAPGHDLRGHVATPHHGELAALCEAFGVTADSHRARASALAKASGLVVVAKGPDTCIAAPDGSVAIAPPASAWLSTAGTGDVLAGLIGSRMAAGADGFTAACEGVWLHGEAARLTPVPFTAGELADHVPAAVRACL